METDAQLVERVRSGDVGAFRVLVERYERSILGAAMARLRDFHAAEDAVQVAFARAYERLSTLRSSDSFGTWLMQIARRQIVDAIRSRQVPVALRTDTPEKSIPTHEQRLDESEHLLSLVNRLPETECVLIGLRHFAGHSVNEIAQITGRPVGTVTKQLSRAHARLREWLEEE